MMSVSFGAMSVLIMTVLALALPILAVWVLAHVIGAVMGVCGACCALVGRTVGGVLGFAGGLVGRSASFVLAELRETLHLVGGILTGLVIAPLAVANLAIGRLRAAGHYGRALEDEVTSAGICLYRVALGHPIRFLGLSALTEGLERRLPELVARAPRGEARRGAELEFEGYEVTGTLPAGGSGAQLFLARPREEKVQSYLQAGHADPGQVVIKAFALEHGSTLPQIVRESRSLEAARHMGLVLDHELSEESFWYVMPYVPGDDLDLVTRRLHARSSSDGLDARGISKVIGYAGDLLATLDRFHAGGLWHKDIKPSNLIVSGDRAHLVDLGLVTPLASAMTLTTHGTEFFRDPELVRLAMKGVKVQEVDGVKFDVYSAGAVLYSMIENSFPAHGSLSRITRNCPDALAWIVRRAMSDIDQRYGSAREMAADLDVLLAAADPFAVRPADLPSMGGATAKATRAAYAPDEPVPLEDLVGASAPVFDPPPSVSPLETDMRARRQGRRGLLTAALVLVMFGLVFGGLFRVATSQWRGPWVVSHSGWRQAPQVRVQVPGEVAVQAPASYRQPPRKLGARRGEGSTVLLLADLALDVDSPQVRGQRAVLLDYGFEVIGDRDGGDDRETIDLIAGARRAVELAGPNDPAARARLQTYLDGQPGLDAVIWLAPGEREGTVSKSFLTRSSPVR